MASWARPKLLSLSPKVHKLMFLCITGSFYWQWQIRNACESLEVFILIHKQWACPWPSTPPPRRQVPTATHRSCGVQRRSGSSDGSSDGCLRRRLMMCKFLALTDDICGRSKQTMWEWECWFKSRLLFLVCHTRRVHWHTNSHPAGPAECEGLPSEFVESNYWFGCKRDKGVTWGVLADVTCVRKEKNGLNHPAGVKSVWEGALVALRLMCIISWVNHLTHQRPRPFF